MPTDIKLDFDAVIIRAKGLLRIESDSELAAALQMTRANFSGLRRRKSIPYSSLVPLLIKHGISLNQVFNQDTTAANRYLMPRPCQVPARDWFNPPQSMPAPRLSAHWQLS